MPGGVPRFWLDQHGIQWGLSPQGEGDGPAFLTTATAPARGRPGAAEPRARIAGLHAGLAVSGLGARQAPTIALIKCLN